MDLVSLRLAAAYREHGSWEFLRNNPDEWQYILTSGPIEFDSLDAIPKGRAPLPYPASAVLRFALRDGEGRWVVGYQAAGADEFQRRSIRVDGHTIGWLTLAAPFHNVTVTGAQRFAEAQFRSTWIIGGVAVLLAAAIALALAHAVLTPVKQVAQATHRLASGDYTIRVRISSNDEVGQLARDFNQLALTLERTERMRRDFMADISHELRTPLGVLNGEIEAIEDGVRALGPDTIQSLRAEVDMLFKLVNDIYDLSLADVGALAYRKADVNVVELLASTAQIFHDRLSVAGAKLDLRLPSGPLIVFADERRLQQMFSNLFENSSRYTDPGGVLRIEARREKNGAIAIDFLDSAPGVSAEQTKRLFERFYRTEDSRNRVTGGSGLGLAIVRSIVEAHEGDIEAKASPLGGLWLVIHLPSLM